MPYVQDTQAMVEPAAGRRNDWWIVARLLQKNPGANCNSLVPIGQGSYEPRSYMSWLSGVPVSVERIDP
jgi:hypothetical protein